MPIPARGGCLCGQIRYVVTREPLVTSLCHCRSCRLATGAPSAAWVILPLDGLTIEQGTPVSFRSSPHVERTFCGRCGTSLTYRRDDRPDSIDIHTATLDEPDAFPPVREIWLEEKIAWMADNPRMAQYPRTSKG
ncbi:MAG TPA: GFA family protein [Kofleriaceae bacterium]|nr:GFA family protein [Kofleriaceae bacterium]